MKKKIKKVLLFITIVIVLLLMISFPIELLKEKQESDRLKEEQRLIENKKRYEEIRSDVNKEMERYHYIIFPTCNPDVTATQRVLDTHLIYNGGMKKEKFLDVDGKSYCNTLTYATCIEKNKWEFKTYLRCKEYTDEGFVSGDYY